MITGGDLIMDYFLRIMEIRVHKTNPQLVVLKSFFSSHSCCGGHNREDGGIVISTEIY